MSNEAAIRKILDDHKWSVLADPCTWPGFSKVAEALVEFGREQALAEKLNADQA